MFFITGDIAVRSKLGLTDTAQVIADALYIPSFKRDKSGRYEELEVFVSECFGLSFGLCQPEGTGPDEYELSILPAVEAFDFDGSENEVDATQYALSLLKNLTEITVMPA